MKGSILYTKLHRPPVAPDIVPRDRLLDRLNAGTSPALDIDLGRGRLRQEQLGQFVDGGAPLPGRMGVVG